MLLIYPTDSTISQLDCSIVDSETCKKVENASGGDASFLEKLKNLLTHGVFGSNMEVMLDKVEDINKEVFEETDLYMNIPLFLSTTRKDTTFEKYFIKKPEDLDLFKIFRHCILASLSGFEPLAFRLGEHFGAVKYSQP